MLKSNLEMNIGYCFIFKVKIVYKIYIYIFDDKVLYCLVGFVWFGEKKGLKKVILLCNELGFVMWGKFWCRILKDFYLMICLLYSLEFKIIYKFRLILDNFMVRDVCYIVVW